MTHAVVEGLIGNGIRDRTTAANSNCCPPNDDCVIPTDAVIASTTKTSSPRDRAAFSHQHPVDNNTATSRTGFSPTELV